MGAIGAPALCGAIQTTWADLTRGKPRQVHDRPGAGRSVEARQRAALELRDEHAFAAAEFSHQGDACAGPEREINATRP